MAARSGNRTLAPGSVVGLKPDFLTDAVWPSVKLVRLEDLGQAEAAAKAAARAAESRLLRDLGAAASGGTLWFMHWSLGWRSAPCGWAHLGRQRHEGLKHL